MLMSIPRGSFMSVIRGNERTYVPSSLNWTTVRLFSSST